MEPESTLREIVHETRDTRTFRFDIAGRFTFEPGQFVNIYAPIPGVARNLLLVDLGLQRAADVVCYRRR
jgi:NAD(P)H-flavin reductase